jgi:NAD-dependent SIR2 family protein deacetylase
MRCKACNKSLNEFESTRKSKESGEYIDLCNDCYAYVKDDLQVVENFDFMDLQDSIDIEDKF